ncbi:rhomboid family intramembrane serine protease [Ferruginibacter sp. HRS2-29]|uniref:rhomboid family intramembrane serine protease n=1 Tax=Ferruginibacter sp. HRS2-29 TaxID=2487334 RepID=UPI0020CB7EEB|nr:rhomboid family intramembrane serine protease [Ferruginibacter sp. HRS2-29]MCP9752915.1 rhomboid family intramembrane serine protease [Ferruginibacter sp. HRS2-29]
MGIADRHMEYEDKYRRKRFTLGQSGNALVALIGLNIIVFVFVLTGNLFYIYTHQGQAVDNFNIIRWFSVPGTLHELATKPWTVFTYMFAHGGGAHVGLMLLNMLSSMLWIWMFGFILQDISGNRFIFPIYIYGGLAGALFFILTATGLQSIPASQFFLSGASASTAALAVAVAFLDPDYRVLRQVGNGIPVWILTVIYLLLNLADIITLSPATFAIIGGASAGGIFVYFLKKGRDGSTWMNNLYDWFNHLFDPAKNARSGPVKDKMFYNTGNREPFTKTSIITQKRVDELLDKINQKGYDSLTEEEKRILKKAAETDDI